ncbi:MAG: hypothetical protein AAB631_01045 [Patescibacteria group bacterium]
MDLNAQIGPSPTVISESREAEADNSLWKLLILLILGGLINVLTTYAFLGFLVQSDYAYLWYTLILGGLFLALVILHAFFIKNRMKLGWILLLECAAPVGLLAGDILKNPSLVFIIGTTVAAGLVIAGGMRGAQALEDTLKIRFFKIAKVVTPKVATGIALFLSAVFYMNYFELGRLNEATAQKILNETLSASTPILHIWFPDTSFDQPVKNFLESSAASQLDKLEDTANAGELTASLKTKIMTQVTGQLRTALERYTGPLTMDAPLKSELYAVLKRQVQKFSVGTQLAVGAGVAFLFFLTLKSMFAIAYWLIWFVAFLLFKFFLTINFAHISLQTRSREFIILS